MKKLWVFVFVIALMIVGFETFKYQPAFPASSGALTQLMNLLPLH
jgi:hypothetical protein